MFSNSRFKLIGQVAGPFGIQKDSPRSDVFLFDVNALFEAHQSEMDRAFSGYLAEFAAQRSCYVLSSLNYAETAVRIPSHLRRTLAGIFSSAGTELWRQNDLLIRHDHDFCDDLYETVAKLVLQSAYPDKQAPLIDCGPATLRICLAGTRIGRTAKRNYVAWEREHRELDKFVAAIRTRFPNHSVCKDSEGSLLIMPNTYSTAKVQEHLLRRHKSARLVAYLGETAARGFAKPMCDAFLKDNILSTVGGASDISQLLSYEMRRMQEHLMVEPAPLRLVHGA